MDKNTLWWITLTVVIISGLVIPAMLQELWKEYKKDRNEKKKK